MTAAQVPWPWPGDTDTDKARRIAHDYRRELARLDPDLCERMDAACRRLGQHWIAPTTDALDLKARMRAVQLSAYLNGEISADRIRQWGARNHIPRHTDDDNHTVYQVSDVLDFLAQQRHARATRVSRHKTP